MADGEVRYCTTADGVRIAYSVWGEGTPLIGLPVLAESFSLRHYFPEGDAFWRALAQRHRLVLLDWGGTGLSQRQTRPMSLETMCLDIEAVASALHLRKFALWASGAPSSVALVYAGKHPKQVSRLVLYGATRGSAGTMGADALRAYGTLWRTNPDIAAQALSDITLRDAHPESGRQLARMHRESIEPEQAALLFEAASEPEWNASLDLASIVAPTLVLHRRDDGLQPFSEGQAIAAGISDARFVPLEGDVHHPALGDTSSVLDAVLTFLAEDEGKRPARKTTSHASGVTTVLFTDLVGHTEMMRRLGDERGREVLREHEHITRDLLKQHGGTEVKTTGDGFMAAFATVTAAMDCAIALQRAFAARDGEPLEVRVGLDAGEPIEEDGDLFGSTVILASRIAERAGSGEILIAEPLRHLLSGKSYVYADRGETVLKGFEEAVRLYEVRWRE